MTWRDVFDSNKKMWGHRDRAADAATSAGYRFMAWNGLIMLIEDDRIIDTGLTTGQLDRTFVMPEGR